jgi:hypothetical protein
LDFNVFRLLKDAIYYYLSLVLIWARFDMKPIGFAFNAFIGLELIENNGAVVLTISALQPQLTALLVEFGGVL